MRLVVQRVSRAEVRRAEDGGTLGEIGPGLMALVGFGQGDGDGEVDWMAEKLCGLRI
ncbi:MAG: D-aminoacyl-tRNA deacylase, partial [Gemmatimonadota bacterium]